MQATVYNELRNYWWLLLLSGALSIFIGGALLFWPGKTLTVVGFLVGPWMLFAGIMRFLIALFGGDTDGRWVILIVGIVGIVRRTHVAEVGDGVAVEIRRVVTAGTDVREIADAVTIGVRLRRV